MAKTKRKRGPNLLRPIINTPQANAPELDSTQRDSQTSPESSGDIWCPQVQNVSAMLTLPDSQNEQSELPDPGEIECLEELSIIDENGTIYRKHGPTRVKDVTALPTGHRIMLNCNEHAQPVDKSGGILGHWIGTLARDGDFCPLSYDDWRLIPKDMKTSLIEFIQSKFVIPSDSRMNTWILDSTNSKWREFKHTLKSKYLPEGCTKAENKEEIKNQLKEKVPPKVNMEQWKVLVEYWFSHKSERRSETGKVARSAQKAPHTSGSKSYARRKKEFAKNIGREPSRIEFYEVTHKKKKNNGELEFTNNTARELVLTAKALMEHKASSSGSSSISRIEHEVFNEVFGEDRGGRVKGYGVGVNSSHLFGPKAQVQNLVNDVDVDRSRVQIEVMEQKHKAELQKVEHKYKAELEAMEQKHKAELQKVEQKYKAELEAMEQKHKAELQFMEQKQQSQLRSVEQEHQTQMSQVQDIITGLRAQLNAVSTLINQFKVTSTSTNCMQLQFPTAFSGGQDNDIRRKQVANIPCGSSDGGSSNDDDDDDD